jgi:hypothetical protein
MNKCDICNKQKPNLIESMDFDDQIGSYDVLVCQDCLKPF